MTPAPAPQKPIVVKFGDISSEGKTHPKWAFTPLLNELEARAEGRLKIERYWGGQLASSSEQFEATASGIIDISKSNPPQGVLYQVMSLSMLPFAYEDPNKGTFALNQLVEKGYGAADLAGLKYFSGGNTYNCDLLFKDKKPMTIEELSGIKMRIPGGYLGKTASILGMVPVKVSAPEIYDAMSKGLMDGGMSIKHAFYDWGVSELAKYELEGPFGCIGVGMFIMNENKWNSLPADIQGIFVDVWGEHATEKYLEANGIGDAYAEARMRDAGLDIYSWSPEEMDKLKKLLLTVWDGAVGDLDNMGLPGKQVMTEWVTALKEMGENPPYTP
ncbi:TRAP transporter substrate-binding protein DctP [Chloroflexota bacterium]